MRAFLLLPGLFLTLVHHISAQNVPPIACPQYFQYLGYNQQYIGLISLPLDPRSENNEIYVEFAQRTPVTSNFVGRISLYDDEVTTRANLRSGQPINYRVDFPTPGVLPKITQIRLNNFVICSAAAYPPPNTLISLTHSLRSTTVPLLSQGGHVLVPAQRTRPQTVQTVPFQPQPQQQPQQQTRPAPTRAPTPAPTRAPAPATAPPRPRPTASSQQLNDVCGRPSPALRPFIFHGVNVASKELPWMAAMYEKNEGGLHFFCGGTLVSRSTVISAGHCFRIGRTLTAERTVVALGRSNLDDYTTGVLRDIEVLRVHESYNRDQFSDADIALLKLKQPVTFDDFIKPICLWNENFLLNLPSGHKSYVAGWGADENGNQNTKVAKMTDADIVTESDCLRRLPGKLVTSRTICAANKNGAGPCNGDSGGGLMLKENNVWLLRGIVSAGISGSVGACDLAKPVIYCDLAKHIQWVRAGMWV